MPVQSKDIFVFTDCDLDGAMCHTILQWCTNSKLPYKVTRVDDFKSTFTKWAENNLEKYKTVYILDLDVSLHADLVDKPNVTIIDHHDSHVMHVDRYKNAKIYVEKETSCAKLLYKICKQADNVKLTAAQKLLISLVDDYDSYTLKTPVSKDLNTIFWSYQGDRVQKFQADWNQGFTGFNDRQQRLLDFKAKSLKSTIEDLEIFELNNFEYEKETYKVVSTIATTDINEIAHHLLHEYNCDISIIVNTNSKKVSFRKSTTCPVLNLATLAKDICGGAGHSNASGGPFNKKFLQFSKLFERIK